jgi:DNA-binding CsgD family transcriptional regulator
LGRFEIALSATHAVLRQYEDAARLAASGLGRAIRSGDRRGIALGSLALHAMPAEYVENRSELPALEAVLDIFHSCGDLMNELHTLATLAQEAVDRDDPRAAAGWVLTRQERLGRTDLLNGLTISVMLGVHISRLRGDYAVGARLHGTVASHMERLMAIMSPVHSALYRSGLETIRASLGPKEFDTQVAGGRMLDRDETLAELMDYLRDVAQVASRGLTPRADDDPRSELTPREQQVLVLLARGLRNKEIASEIRVTPKTVMHHTVSIYRKLGVRGRTEAVTTAASKGLLPLR